MRYNPLQMKLVRTFSAALLCAAVAAPMVPRTATAKPKRAKPACGIRFLPLTEGATWVYEYEPPVKDQPTRRGPKVAPPATVTIKVVSVKSSRKSATVVLEESFRKVKLTTEVTCSPDGLVVSPHSFLWNGEPGGGLAQSFDSLKRDGVSFPGKAGLKGEFSEEISAKVTRAAAREDLGKPLTVTVEVERTVKVAGKESIVIGDQDVSATRLDISLKGRATIEGRDNASTEMRSNTSALLWFADGRGLLRVQNPKGHAYNLTVPSDAAPGGAAPQKSSR